jgi:hypothetical protein
MPMNSSMLATGCFIRRTMLSLNFIFNTAIERPLFAIADRRNIPSQKKIQTVDR